jgi:membrane-bound serine protease (ClpP class)
VTELVVVVIFAVGLLMVLAETLMPGVIIGVLGALAILASVGLAYFHPDINNPALAAILLGISLAVVPAAYIAAARRLKLKTVLDEKSGVTAFSEDFTPLMNKTGAALTDLCPSGLVMIDGKKYDVLTPGEVVARGAAVRVTEVSGNRIVVRAE